MITLPTIDAATVRHLRQKRPETPPWLSRHTCANGMTCRKCDQLQRLAPREANRRAVEVAREAVPLTHTASASQLVALSSPFPLRVALDNKQRGTPTTLPTDRWRELQRCQAAAEAEVSRTLERQQERSSSQANRLREKQRRNPLAAPLKPRDCLVPRPQLTADEIAEREKAAELAAEQKRRAAEEAALEARLRADEEAIAKIEGEVIKLRASQDELFVGWAEFGHALPVGKDTLSALRMRVLFGKWDGNSNKSISLREISEAMLAAMQDLPEGLRQRAHETWALAWNSHVRPLARFLVRERDAFRAANRQRLPQPRKHDYVERDEFRILLLCLRQYACMYAGLEDLMNGGQRLSAVGFEAARPVFEKWGLRLTGSEPEVAEVAAELLATRGGIEPMLRWAVEEGHLRIVDSCAEHAVTGLDGEHFKWVFE